MPLSHVLGKLENAISRRTLTLKILFKLKDSGSFTTLFSTFVSAVLAEEESYITPENSLF